MTEKDLLSYLKTNYPKENDTCEWKAFSSLEKDVSGRKSEDVISYISAIANANGGTLIIGIEDSKHVIKGVVNAHDFTPENMPPRLLGNCPNLSSEGLEVEQYITSDTQQNVWIIHIPKHSPRKPVYAHKTAWFRKGDNLISMTKERENAILSESLRVLDDWSAMVCKDATINDLDYQAIEQARKNYFSKFPEQALWSSEWDNITFLNKAKITIRGNITRTAILLLGKSESEHFLSPSETKIRWILKDRENLEKDYSIFTPPFILAVDKVFAKIRIIKFRYLRDETLFPEEVDQYEPYVIREALNNCIAHQDYANLAGMINVIEKEDELIFTNLGSFIPESIEKVISEDAPEEIYRNPFLSHAMFNLKMVDTIGSGIKSMFNYQRKKFFPMPEYDFSKGKVKVTIIGKVLDINYAKTLIQHPELSLQEIMMLDKVQKK